MRKGQPGAWFADRAVSLRDGEAATADLSLSQVSMAHRPGAQVFLDQSPKAEAIHEEYRLPQSGLALAGVGPVASGRDYDVPDLRAFGLVVCTQTFHWDPYLRSGDIVCGGPPEKPSALRLRTAPAFSAPPVGTRATPGMTFAWSTVADAVYVLELKPLRPNAANPSIKVVTSRPLVTWPDLHDVGVAFPQDPGGYAATIAARGPYPTIDDAFGPAGFGARVPPETWWTQSYELALHAPGEVSLWPPQPPPLPPALQRPPPPPSAPSKP
jgi:hypothetical protein